jgi:hypothetical protein
MVLPQLVVPPPPSLLVGTETARVCKNRTAVPSTINMRFTIVFSLGTSDLNADSVTTLGASNNMTFDL